MTTSDPRRDLLDRAEAEWKRFLRVFDAWPGEIHGEGSDWRPRDEWAHHARWLAHAHDRLRAHLAGRPLPEVDADEANARWRAEDRALTEADARARLDTAREALVDEVRRLPASATARGVEIVAEDLVDHFGYHIEFAVDAFVREDARRWLRLVEVLDAAGDGVAHREGPPWTVRDVYAHLARWMRRAAEYVPAYLEGAPPEPVTDYDTLNARWHAEDQRLSLEEARRAALAAHDDVVRVMRSIPASRWDARVFGVFAGNTTGHYAEHLAYMGLAEPRP